MAIQLDLFRQTDEIEELRQEIKQLKDTTGNVRRGLFARHNELVKKYIDLLTDHEALWVEINKIKKTLQKRNEDESTT